MTGAGSGSLRGSTWGVPSPEYAGNAMPGRRTNPIDMFGDSGTASFDDFGDQWCHMVRIVNLMTATSSAGRQCDIRSDRLICVGLLAKLRGRPVVHAATAAVVESRKGAVAAGVGSSC